MPKRVTFIQTPNQIEPFIKAGAEEFIIDHSDYSIRSFHQNKTPFHQWLKEIKKVSKKIPLWFNCDGLWHEEQINTIDPLIEQLQKNSIHQIKVQDHGLIDIFKEKTPSTNIMFCQEFGGQNQLHSKTIAEKCTHQYINHETPIHTIKQLKKHIQTKWAIQVFGPILIQYSYRRFLKNYTKKNQLHHYNAADKEYPNRWYTFLDNPHGHFMYLYFEKSLLTYLKELESLKLNQWIIDGRGYPDEYTINALKLFKKEQSKIKKGTFNNTKVDLDFFKTIHQKPFKPAFFKHNRTDQVFKKPSELTQKMTPIGWVKDHIKGKLIAIECTKSLKINDTLHFKTPQGKWLNQTIKTIKNINLKKQTEIKENQIALINWEQKIDPKSQIFTLPQIKNV